jgi:hypothetical protein
VKNACVTRYGLVNDEVRKKVWPLLLNVETLNSKALGRGSPLSSKNSTKGPDSTFGSMMSERDTQITKPSSTTLSFLPISEDTSWKTHLKRHREDDQIEKDIRRSLNQMDICEIMPKQQK